MESVKGRACVLQDISKDESDIASNGVGGHSCKSRAISQKLSLEKLHPASEAFVEPNKVPLSLLNPMLSTKRAPCTLGSPCVIFHVNLSQPAPVKHG